MQYTQWLGIGFLTVVALLLGLTVAFIVVSIRQQRAYDRASLPDIVIPGQEPEEPDVITAEQDEVLAESAFSLAEDEDTTGDAEANELLTAAQAATDDVSAAPPSRKALRGLRKK